MSAASVRSWKKIGLFFALTMLFSGLFDAFILHAGRMDAGNLLYITGGMWSPALATFVTKAVFRESIGDLAWRWPAIRYAWLGYFIPFVYAVPIYLVVWGTGLGGFASGDFVRQIDRQFGWPNFPSGLTITLFVVLTATLGLVGKMARALGEEIGWRGFLVPELSKVVSFPATATISGLLWAVYHFPILLFADYNFGAPPWYSLTCFTFMVVADSFILAWLTFRSGSLWPAAILHGSHNLFIQSILTPLTRDTGPARYIIDEFGIGLVITTTIGALIVCRRAKAFSNQELIS